MPSFFLRPVALAALLCAGAAQAAVPYVETSAFTLQGYANYPDSVVDVLADTGESITLGLPTFAVQTSSDLADSQQSSIGEDTAGGSARALYDIRPRQGYRITGVEFSGTAHGMFVYGGGDWPGFTSNFLSMAYRIERWENGFGFTVASERNFVSGLQGEQQVAMTTRSLALDKEFSIQLGGYTSAVAYGGYIYNGWSEYDYIRTRSLADMDLRDVTLTFTVVAVPEPQTWLLMLGGLAAIGAAASRSRTRG